MRLACLFAVLDCSDVIKLPHLNAALVLWEYSEQSVEYVFGNKTGNAIADRIYESLKSRPEGLTRTQIWDIFGRHVKVLRLNHALEILTVEGLAYHEEIKTSGRTEQLWKTVAK